MHYFDHSTIFFIIILGTIMCLRNSQYTLSYVQQQLLVDKDKLDYGNANLHKCVHYKRQVYLFTTITPLWSFFSCMYDILRIFAYHFSVQFLTTWKNWYCVGVRAVGFSIKVMHNELLLMFRWFLICKVTYTCKFCEQGVSKLVYLSTFFPNNLIFDRFWKQFIWCNL